MTILVTGAAGFAGSHIIARLVAEGERPRALVRDAAKARQRLPASDVEIVVGDTTVPATLDAAVAGVETIIHAAFITADRKQGPGVNYEQTNVQGTKNLLAAAKRAGVGRIVELGGLGTKAAPRGTYMYTRYAADEAIKASGLGWSILGPSVQFGHGAAFFTGLTNLIRSAPVVPMIGDGKLLFQPIWVEDVTTCLLKMAREPQRYDGQYIEVGGPEVLTYRQILQLLQGALHTRKPLVPGPVPLAKLGASLMAAVLSKPPVTPAAIELFDFDNVATPNAVEQSFGFTPRAFTEYLAVEGVG